MSTVAERLRPHFRAQFSAALSLTNDRTFAVALLLAVVPIWVGRYVPLIDMPQHAAQITALHELWSGNATFSGLFEINWFTPYLLGYLLLYGASLVMPVAVATQLLVSVAVIALPLATAHLLRVVGADVRWRWLAIPCAFSFAFYWGFLSYIVAAPIALLFIARTVRFVQVPSVRNAVAIAVFAHLLFFCHVIVLGTASLAALGYVAGATYRDPKTLALRCLPYTTPLPLIAVWFAATYRAETSVQNDPIVYGGIDERFYQLLVQPAGQDRISLVTLLVTVAVVMLPALAGSTFSRKPERWLPGALMLLAFVLMPHYVMSTAYVFQRLGLFLVPLWLMAWDPPGALRRRVEGLAIAAVLLVSFTNIGRFVGFARETESFRDVLAAVPPRHTIASMVYDPYSEFFTLPVYLHFPVWYQANASGIVDFNFANFFSQMVRYRRHASGMTDDLTWTPTEFDWKTNGGERYDYFIVKSSSDVSPDIFKEQRDSVELVTRSGWWWLYRNLHRAAPAQGASASAFDALGDHEERTANRQ
jgi:hypothetical protein